MSASIMGWKSETASPLGCAEENCWFLTEYEEKENGLKEGSFCSLTRKEIAQQLLEDIDSLVKEENEDTFSEWFEGKINLPIFDEIEPVLATDDLKPGLEERDVDEALSRANLTPPLSPDNPEAAAYIILDCLPENRSYGNDSAQSNFLNEENYIVLPENYQIEQEESPDYLTAPPTPVPDLEKELALVDELVRSTAQRLDSNIWESDSTNSRSSSSDCVGSPGSAGFEEESDDPEWVPVLKKTIVKRHMRRSKPYGREFSQEDRWLRKKEQNKNAATRYRQKKKAEVTEILEEEKKLEEEKTKLKMKVADIQMEIKYIKGLMRELFKAKGLIMN